jgi:hypothetical protein
MSINTFSIGQIPTALRMLSVGAMTGVAATKTVTAVPTLCYPTYYFGGLQGFALAATPTTEEVLTDGGLIQLSDTDPILIREIQAAVGSAQTYTITLHDMTASDATRDVTILTTEGGHLTRKCLINPVIVMPYQQVKIVTTAAGSITLILTRAAASSLT